MEKLLVLNKLMKEIVNNNCENYKNDALIDLNILMNKENPNKEFIWIVKKCGTELLEKTRAYIRGDYSNDLLEYNLHSKETRKIYLIKVEKVGKKLVYGSIRELSIDKLKRTFKVSTKTVSKIDIVLITKDNGKIEKTIDWQIHWFEELVNDLKLTTDKVKAVYISKVA